MDGADGHIANGSSCTAKVSNNVRIPDGNSYHGNLITEILPGDVNEDGVLDATDAAILPDFLLTRPADSVSLIGSDLSMDGCLDVLDLALVKRKLLNNQKTDEVNQNK